MVSITTFRQMALSFPETTEQPHFEKAAFRSKKRIFASLSEAENIATVKLSEIDQSVFCDYDETIVYPVPNKWGKQGWTHINLKKVPNSMLKDLLSTAYHESVKKK